MLRKVLEEGWVAYYYTIPGLNPVYFDSAEKTIWHKGFVAGFLTAKQVTFRTQEDKGFIFLKLELAKAQEILGEICKHTISQLQFKQIRPRQPGEEKVRGPYYAGFPGADFVFVDE